VSLSKRFSTVLGESTVIPFDDQSKLILFSDCHRGDNSWADDFAHNQNLFFYALEYYFEAGFTYIELGDGDELLENRAFEDIRRAHSHVFRIMQKFHQQNRLYLLFGNHDIVRQSPETVGDHFHSPYRIRGRPQEPLFGGIQVHEGLRLEHPAAGEIFLIHGHQGDLINDSLWRLGRFFVRHVWRHLQLLGIRDPTSPAQNIKKRNKVELEIARWSKTRRQMLIFGHTHRPRFAALGDIPVFNTGSCVHPRSITGIEIENGEISLIKWSVKPASGSKGALFVVRENLDGPTPLAAYAELNAPERAQAEYREWIGD
jgi:predicted phosphodiesterase